MARASKTPAENGLSHFIEHLLFKGTKKRTAAQIAEEIDAVGGVLNAFTGKEYTCYYAKVLGDDLKMATELLADIFLESVFDQDEIVRERQVVIQEISQAEDTPGRFHPRPLQPRFLERASAGPADFRLARHGQHFRSRGGGHVPCGAISRRADLHLRGGSGESP